MAISKVDKTHKVVADAANFGARAFDDLTLTGKPKNLVQIFQNGFVLGKITNSAKLSFAKIKLDKPVKNKKTGISIDTVFISKSELTYEKDYKKTTKTENQSNTLKDFYIRKGVNMVNVRDKPTVFNSKKIGAQLNEGDYVGKSDGEIIVNNIPKDSPFQKFINDKGAVYYVSSDFVTDTKLSLEVDEKPIENPDKGIGEIQPMDNKNDVIYLDSKANWTNWIIAIVVLLIIIGYLVHRHQKDNKAQFDNYETIGSEPEQRQIGS